jgi:hypothetical protein
MGSSLFLGIPDFVDFDVFLKINEAFIIGTFQVKPPRGGTMGRRISTNFFSTDSPIKLK